MPAVPIPSIDQNICSGWTENQINLYNKSDFYLAKLAVKQRSTWSTWGKITGKVTWKRNMGPIMRGVYKVPSPHLRQFAFPTNVNANAKKDIVQVRELKTDVEVHHHKFESPIFNFLPDFRDFMTDHVKAHGMDIEEKKTRYEDVYIRGKIFHQSPYVMFPGVAGSIEDAPQGDGNSAGTSAKTTAYLQAKLPTITKNGLLITDLNVLLSIMDTDLRVLPFQGDGSQPKDSGPLNDKYLLVCSTEAWNQFVFDPWLLSNKNCNLNLITEGFRGDFFGRIIARLEDRPIRIATDGTFPAPEAIETNPDAWDYGEPKVTAAYKDAPYEVAFLVGDGQEAYKSLEVGPPPKEFSGNGMPDGFGKMFWNGETILTKNLLIKCTDDDDQTIWEPNAYGEYLKFISHLTLGLLPVRKRNVIPIIFKRMRGPHTA